MRKVGLEIMILTGRIEDKKKIKHNILNEHGGTGAGRNNRKKVY